jgi:hypothetical protein
MQRKPLCNSRLLHEFVLECNDKHHKTEGKSSINLGFEVTYMYSFHVDKQNPSNHEVRFPVLPTLVFVFSWVAWCTDSWAKHKKDPNTHLSHPGNLEQADLRLDQSQQNKGELVFNHLMTAHKISAWNASQQASAGLPCMNTGIFLWLIVNNWNDARDKNIIEPRNVILVNKEKKTPALHAQQACCVDLYMPCDER